MDVAFFILLLLSFSVLCALFLETHKFPSKLFFIWILFANWFSFSINNIKPNVSYSEIQNVEINGKFSHQVSLTDINVTKKFGKIFDPDTEVLKISYYYSQWSYGIYCILKQDKYEVINKSDVPTIKNQD